MGTLQIRNVPDDLSRELKARAALAGTSLSDYLLAELTKMTTKPSLEQIWERISRDPVEGLRPAADVLAEERAAR